MTMPLNPVEQEFSPELDKLAAELAKHIKTEQDLTALSRHLLKRTVESALQAELDEHLGYEAACGRGPRQRQQPEWVFEQDAQRRVGRSVDQTRAIATAVFNRN